MSSDNGLAVNLILQNDCYVLYLSSEICLSTVVVVFCILQSLKIVLLLM